MQGWARRDLWPCGVLTRRRQSEGAVFWLSCHALAVAPDHAARPLPELLSTAPAKQDASHNYRCAAGSQQQVAICTQHAPRRARRSLQLAKALACQHACAACVRAALPPQVLQTRGRRRAPACWQPPPPLPDHAPRPDQIKSDQITPPPPAALPRAPPALQGLCRRPRSAPPPQNRHQTRRRLRVHEHER